MPYCIVLLFLSLATCAVGQVPADSSFLLAARKQAIGAYEQVVHEQAHVYEGNEYIGLDHRIKVHPFYPIDSLQRGTITYNGVHYQGVQMLYDIVRDELVIQPPGGGYRLQLRNDYVAAFSLGTHQFSRIIGDSAAGVPTGFYEVLHTGRIKALARRVKTVYEDISSGTYQAEYLVKDRFFILKDGIYYEVKNRQSLLRLFPDQAKALRKVIRTAKLTFNNGGREAAVSQLTNRYEELIK